MLSNLFIACFFPLMMTSNYITGNDTSETNDKEWKCLYSSDYMSQYERWVEFENGNSTKERKCELIIDCTIDSAYNFLINPENTKLWMDGIRKVEFLQSETDDKEYLYTIFEFPWPFKDMDMVSSYTPTIVSNEHYLIQIESAKNFIKENPKLMRINEYHATWEIMKLDSGKTKIIFKVYADTRPVVARFIQDPIVNKIFIKNFDRLKNILTMQKHQADLANS